MVASSLIVRLSVLKSSFMTKLSFNNKKNTFYASLKASVDQYFTTQKIKKTGNWKLYAKTGVLIPGALAIYVGLMWLFRTSGPAASGGLVFAGIVLCGILGLALAS